MGFGNAAYADAFQGCEESGAAIGGEAFVGDDEEEDEEKKVGLRDDVPCEDGGRVASGEGPEEKERDEKWGGDCGCEGVRPLVVREGGGGA